MEANDDRARIIRLEGEIQYLRERLSASGAIPPAPVRTRGGSLLNFLGSLVLIAVCLFGLWALLTDSARNLAGTPQTVYSTPAALPTAAIAPNGAAARTDTYTHNAEATFPAPVPQPPKDAPAAVIPPTWTPWPPDDGATAQAATDAAGVLTATAEQQGAIDRWVNGPPSTPTPTVWADYVETFATPEPCSQFIGRVGAARAACATPTPEE